MSSTTLATVSTLSGAAVATAATAAVFWWNRSAPAAAPAAFKPWVISNAELAHVDGPSIFFVCQFHGTDERRCQQYKKCYEPVHGDLETLMVEARHRPMLCWEHRKVLEARGHISTSGHLTELGAEHCEAAAPAAAKPWVIRPAKLEHVGIGWEQAFPCQFHGTDESQCRRYRKFYDRSTDGCMFKLMKEARQQPMLCREHSNVLKARGHITTEGYLTALGAEYCEGL